MNQDNKINKMLSATTSASTPELVLDAKAQLGEGALWQAEEQRLYWVDIEGKTLHIFDPASGEDREIQVGQRIGTVVPTADGQVLVALQNGIHRLNPATGQMRFVTNPLPNADMRFNDGKCDPFGRFWVGSMHLEQKERAASLYRMEADGSMEEVLQGITVSNGLVWSQDQQTMFYIDSPTRKIQAFDFEPGSGALSGRRIVAEVPKEAGYPDGMAIDAEGKLWVAHWGGNAVIRWDPANGQMMQKIIVPAPHVTSCAFGGKQLETLYITTAREGLDDKQLKEFPESGGIFALNPGIRGLPTYTFRGTLP
jgi:sugar lactone lactonase YvrE